MAKRLVSDEIAFKCYQVLETMETVERLADEAFSMIHLEGATSQDCYLRLGFHNLRTYVQSWKQNTFIEPAIIQQAKEQFDDEF